MKKYIVLIIILVSFSLSAQKIISFQVDAGGKMKKGSNVTLEGLNFSLNCGLNYTHFIKPRFAIETGLGLSKYTTKFLLPNSYNTTTNEIDAAGSGFELTTTAGGLSETQNTLLATIPLRLRFEGALLPGGREFYASAGVKFLVPVSRKSTFSASELTTKGFYPNYNLVVEDVPERGLSSQNNVEVAINSSYRKSIALSSELGIKLKLENNYTIYFGIYADYGLTSFGDKESAKSLINYTGNSANTYNSITSFKNDDIVAGLVCYGFQLRLPIYTFKENKDVLDKKQ